MGTQVSESIMQTVPALGIDPDSQTIAAEVRRQCNECNLSPHEAVVLQVLAAKLVEFSDRGCANSFVALRLKEAYSSLLCQQKSRLAAEVGARAASGLNPLRTSNRGEKDLGQYLVEAFHAMGENRTVCEEAPVFARLIRECHIHPIYHGPLLHAIELRIAFCQERGMAEWAALGFLICCKSALQQKIDALQEHTASLEQQHAEDVRVTADLLAAVGVTTA